MTSKDTAPEVDRLIEQLEERAKRMDYAGDGLEYYGHGDAHLDRMAIARIVELEAHKRKQAQDIKVLGALVYDESDPPVSWLSRAEAAEARIAELERERDEAEKLLVEARDKAAKYLRERDHWHAQVKQVLDPSYLDEKLEQIGIYAERDSLAFCVERLRGVLEEIRDLPLNLPVKTTPIFDHRGKHVGNSLDEDISLAHMEQIIASNHAARIARTALKEIEDAAE